MGYTTDFSGSINVVPPMSEKLCIFLTKFSDTRRMERTQGPYYVEDGNEGVTNGNQPPEGQPGLWCNWVPSKCGTFIEWNEAEKFYESEEWMKYIIEHFLVPAGHICNGEIEANGEDPQDMWLLAVKDNVVSVAQGSISYGEPYEI